MSYRPIRSLGVPIAATALAVAILLSIVPAFAASDTTPPSVPGSVEATASATPPVIATVTWDASTDDVGVTGYYVWRSMTTTATPTRIGETSALTFDDETGVPGQTYYYYVSAFDAARNESARSTIAGPVVAGWTMAPHATYTSAGDYCRMCHAPHQAASQASLMRPTSREPGELSVCYACHDGQGASTNIISGTENSFALESGHTLEAVTTGADLTNLCSSCHNVHKDYSPTTGEPMLPRVTINGAAVDGADNSWCFACHNDTNDWYGAGYPAPSSPSRDASGYPVLGRFPGATTYADTAANAHASIPASGTVRQNGDCLYCHDSHRSENIYDGLVDTYRPSVASSVVDDQDNGTYAAVCFGCHDDIKQFVIAGDPNSGHRIETDGGTLPVGAPLPCYNCHNPHGSTRGNTMLISDELGGSLEPTATGTDATAAAKVRQFCFTCHTTDDTARGWDSGTSAYVAVGSDTVEGLRRDGTLLPGQTNPTGANRLRLPLANGHSEADAQNCYNCHGSDYSAGGKNVHNPSGGVSLGGEACYSCHGVYEAPMEYDGSTRTDYYHHVLGTPSTSGDGAFSPTTYPAAGTDVYCLSCHVDHDKFNSDNAANLRDSIGATPSGATASNTDYSAASATYGVCLGCHNVELAKDTANQRSSANTAGADNTAYTPDIDGADFQTSAHQYTVSSTYGDATSFNANCSKCHNDENQGSYKQFQTSTNKFGIHWNSSRRILAALGRSTPVSDNPFADEDFCYRCHSVTGDGFKSTAGRDWYGSAGSVMSSASENIYRQFTTTPNNGANIFKHGVATYSGLHKPAASDEPITYFNTLANKHVECADCHNPHATGQLANGTSSTHSLGTNVISPVLAGVRGVTYTSAAERNTSWDPAVSGITREAPGTFGGSLTTVTKEYEICLRCHSSVNQNVWSWGGDWTDVALEFNTGNSSYHPVFGPSGSGNTPLLATQMTAAWSSVGAQTMYCSDCHGATASDPPAMGPHGSSARRVLKGYYPYKADGTTLYTLQDITNGTATDLLCLNCHPMLTAGNFLNAVHNRSNHNGSNSQCTVCHIARPHGGKMPRLMVDDGRDGVGGTPTPYIGPNANISRFQVGAYSNRNSDCLVSATAVCGTAHGGSTGQDW